MATERISHKYTLQSKLSKTHFAQTVHELKNSSLVAICKSGDPFNGIVYMKPRLNGIMRCRFAQVHFE